MLCSFWYGKEESRAAKVTVKQKRGESTGIGAARREEQGRERKSSKGVGIEKLGLGDSLAPFSFVLEEFLPGREEFGFALEQAILIQDGCDVDFAVNVDATNEELAHVIAG